MTKRLSMSETKERLSEVVAQICSDKEPVVLEQPGKPVGVLISPEQYERYEEFVRERFREAVDEIQRRNAEKDPDEVFRDVTSAVEEVRREQYLREHHDRGSPGGC